MAGGDLQAICPDYPAPAQAAHRCQPVELAWEWENVRPPTPDSDGKVPVQGRLETDLVVFVHQLKAELMAIQLSPDGLRQGTTGGPSAEWSCSLLHASLAALYQPLGRLDRAPTRDLAGID